MSAPPLVDRHPIKQLCDRFAAVTDPRIERTKEHLLLDILVLATCAVLCGANDWVAIATFGRAKHAFFARFLALPNGIPSHDTFGRVFARLDPAHLDTVLRTWIADLVTGAAGQIVPIDGKTLCGSRDKPNGQAALHMVSAWASANGAGVCLGQVAVEAKSNEITAIPLLLRMLDLQGCIVTIDAMGCQTAIAAQIDGAGADYVLALKGNHGTLHADVIRVFGQAEAHEFRQVAMQYTATLGKGHGRIERRQYWLLTDPRYLAYLDPQRNWAGLRGIGVVEAERRINGVATVERRYYLTSLTEVRELARAVRGHWGIENGLHWVLDVAFREDDNRTRTGHSAENLAVVRHLALNLLKQETTVTAGTATKRLKAGWDETYLLKILMAGAN